VRIGRIDGSLYGRARLRDVRIADPDGVFLVIPAARLDWRPLAWFANRLDIRRLSAETARLDRLPRLRRTGAPFRLPGFDIRLDALRIDRLQIGAGIAGPARTGRLALAADIRDRHARVTGALATSAGDRLRIHLDAAPERDRFELAARLAAPAGGVIGSVVGAKRPLAAAVTGGGRWADWRGAATLDAGGTPLARLALTNRAGAYRARGALTLETVTRGRLQRLAAPQIELDGTARLDGRVLSGRLDLRSAALAVATAGALDFARGAYDAVTIRAALIDPAALFRNMRGRDVRLRALFDGPFGTARFRYRIDTPAVAFDQTGFEAVRIDGSGRLSPAPVTVPARLSARRVTGVGAVAGGILANLTVAGELQVSARTITGTGLRVRSDRLTSRAALFVDLVTGDYDVTLAGELARYLIPGLGIVDVRSELKVVPGPGRIGTRVVGRARAWVRRFDNGFLAGLAGGLPMIDTQLERGRDGVIRFSGLRLRAPLLDLGAAGIRRRDGSFALEAAGTHGRYGPVRLTLDGRIERPALDIRLARPLPALRLAEVRIELTPDAAGYGYRAGGGSLLGAWTSAGALALPPGAPARLAVDRLDVAGTRAQGALVAGTGGFDGRLAVTGAGLAGAIEFDRPGQVQRIAVDLDADNARLALQPALAIRRGALDGEFLLGADGLVTDATLTARGLRRGTLSLAQLAVQARLRDGAGEVKAAIAGARGRAFELQMVADVAADRVVLRGDGTIDRKPIALAAPAEFVRAGDGWQLRPVRLRHAGGHLDLAGSLAPAETRLAASLSAIPLSAFDILKPDLGLDGSVTGRIDYRRGAGELPAGTATLTVRGLSRAALLLSSQPIDLGVNAVLGNGRAGIRAVAAGGGRTIGRAQARLAPVRTDLDIADALLAAPLVGQLRYTGPADTLWRLSGIRQFDLAGPVAIAADVTGSLADPAIRGSLRLSKARLESATTGTVLADLNASGRFAGSRLAVEEFAAAAGDGRVSGTGSFDFGAARGVAMDLRVEADRAVLINRDDLGATVTGPLAIRSDGFGGRISGQIALDRSRYRLGRAAAAQAVPRLAVTELNRDAPGDVDGSGAGPWFLDLTAVARNRLMVTGLGLDSEWRARFDIGGTVTEPTLLGDAVLLRGGYEFAGRRFELDRGAIRFNGASPPDPVLDISALANLPGLNASIRVAGTGLKPELAFTSTPALPEDELLSRLLFGTSITNLSAPEAVQLASAVAALQSGGGLDPINQFRQAIGLDRLRVLPADPALGTGTAVAAGKYLTRRAFVEIVTDGQGYSATRVEFQITRWLSLLSSISTIGRQSANVRISRDY
jgi:translocation and assembly module TamB